MLIKRVLHIYIIVSYCLGWGACAIDVLNRIRQLRDKRGWSNYRLSREAQISEGSLNNLFRLNNQPTLPTLRAICSGFGITLSQFFAEEGDAVVLSQEQREMLDIFNMLNKRQKEALLELMRRM